MKNISAIHNDAVDLLHRLCTNDGILASTIEADNYKRIWARDSIVCGLAGILLKDPLIMDGLKNSLLTLSKGQHELGMIPSNILPGDSKDISFGSLAGRIDANTWFIIGSCLYFLTSEDDETWNNLKSAVQKCRIFLNTVEFNDRGWTYTPISGNWADEYPVHGYTLYDNCLRLWGEKLWTKITGELLDGYDELVEKTCSNFWPTSATDTRTIYQTTAFNHALEDKIMHYAAFILPGNYDLRFDAAGNALAHLIFEPDANKKNTTRAFLSQLNSDLGRLAIPAFWPMITRESPDWNLLAGNYSFDFKNHPGYFHNGGIWPVWMGLYCLGLSKIGLEEEVNQICSEFEKMVSSAENWSFQEYFNAVDFKTGGKTEMGYTASGIVYMNSALSGSNIATMLQL
ncbi:MAG: hypothetical protein DWP94_11535 [Flavobacterium sp.]|nr:MAG: hypothetical protein DWP94_11535 [Flavobacterium sp.]